MCMKGKVRCISGDLCGARPNMWFIVWFGMLLGLLFAAQNIMAPNLSLIAQEFNFSLSERDVYLGGYISLGFFTVPCFTSLGFGVLTDQYNRKLLFMFVVLFGQVAALGTYFIPVNNKFDFWILWILRVVSGISIGASIPIQYSLFGDLYGETERGKALSMLAIFMGAGTGFGQLIAGFLTPNWRLPFLFISIPSFAILPIFFFTVSEPARGNADIANLPKRSKRSFSTGLFEKLGKSISLYSLSTESFFRSDKKKSSVSKQAPDNLEQSLLVTKLSSESLESNVINGLKDIFSKKTVILLFCQGIPSTISWSVTSVFLNDYLINEKEFSPMTALFVLAGLGVGMFSGSVFIGVIHDEASKRYGVKSKRWMLILAGASTTLSTSPLYYIFNIRSNKNDNKWSTIFCLAFSGFLATFSNIIIKNTLISLTLPQNRGKVFSILNFFDSIGKGIGPFIISYLIKASGSRSAGLGYGIMGWYAASIIHVLASVYVTTDYEKTILTLEQQLIIS